MLFTRLILQPMHFDELFLFGYPVRVVARLTQQRRPRTLVFFQSRVFSHETHPALCLLDTIILSSGRAHAKASVVKLSALLPHRSIPLVY